MTKSVAVVAFPEPSLPAFLSHIGNFQASVSEATPGSPRVLIIVDRGDYRRARRLSGTEVVSLSAAIAIERQVRAGNLRLIEYRDHYSGEGEPADYRYRSHETAHGLDGDDLDRRVREGHGGWNRYARTPHQRSVRLAMGTDEDDFDAKRRADARMLKRIHRGDALGREETNGYVEKLLHKLSAAAYVKRRLNESEAYAGPPVVGVVGGPEYEVAYEVMRERGHGLADNVERFFSPDRQYQYLTYEIASRVSELAREAVGADDDGAFVLGPHLGSLDAFSDPRQVQLSFERLEDRFDDPDELEAYLDRKVDEVLGELRLIDSGVGSRLRYDARYVVEGLVADPPAPLAGSPAVDAIAETTDDAVLGPTGTIRRRIGSALASLELATRLRELAADYPACVLLVAAAVYTDPRYNYERHPSFHDRRLRRSRIGWFRRGLSGPSDGDERWRETQSVMEEWTRERRWYETPAREAARRVA